MAYLSFTVMDEQLCDVWLRRVVALFLVVRARAWWKNRCTAVYDVMLMLM